MRAIPGTAAAILAGIVALASAPVPKEIHGRVLAGDGKPLAHAIVRVVPEIPSPATAAERHVETAEDGTFTLREIASPFSTLRIGSKGFAPATRKHVPPGAAVEVKLAKGISLTGVVRDLITRQPIPGAVVRAWDADAAPFGEAAFSSTTSGADGRFVVADLPPGFVKVDAKAAAHLAATVSKVSLPRTAPPLEVDLDPRAALSVRLVGPGEKSPAELAAEVRIEPPARSPAAPRPAAVPVGRDQIAAGERGTFTIRGLTPGTYTLRLIPAGFDEVVREHVKLERGAIADLGTIALRESADLAGRVTDGTGAPVAGATVVASWTEAAADKSKQARTDKDGRYAIAGLSTVPVDLILVRAHGFATYRRHGGIPKDGVVDAVLERAGSIAGSVALPGGGAPASFRITARTEGDGAPAESDRPSPRVAVDPSGTFRVDDLDPGIYTIEVVADRGARATKSGIVVASEQVADAGILTLGAPSGLRGHVVDARNRSPVAGAAIRVLAVSAPGSANGSAGVDVGRAVSGSDGAFSVEGVRDGDFLVIAEHPVFAPARVGASLREDGDPIDVIVTMYRGGTLVGTVLDAQRQPAADVKITIAGGDAGDTRTVSTGPDGRYFAENLAPGTYDVVRQPAGTGVAVRKPAEIRAEETTTVDFDGAARIVVRGRLLRGDAPLPNSSIVLLAFDPAVPGEVKSTRSDSEGAFELDLDHPGVYQASVSTLAGGGAPAGRSSVKLVVPDQPELEQDIVLQSNSISGRITDVDGKGIKGATVAGTRDSSGAPDAARSATAPTGADGAYRLDGLDAGTYRVIARVTGFRVAEAYPVVVSEETPNPTADLTLERGWILKGRVVDPQGRGLAGALVVIAAPGQAESGALSTSSDPSGSFKITAPGEGSMSVAAWAQGFAPACLEDVPPPAGSDDAPVVLRATPGGALRVRVVDRSGQPVVAARIAIRPDPLFPGSDLLTADRFAPPPTDADGVTRVGFLLPRNYTVSVPGRKGADQAAVSVGEGAEAFVSLTVP